MNTSLSNLVNQALPAVSGSSLSYNSDRNMYLTTAYTSAMGHSYFQGIQLSNRVAVVYNIGRGGWGSNPFFLNGVTVYCFDGRDKKIIGRWSPDSWAFYSDCLAKRVAVKLLYDYLKSQLLLKGAYVADSDLKSFADAQIEAAANNRPRLTA